MTFNRALPKTTSERVFADDGKPRAPVPRWAKVQGLSEPRMRNVKRLREEREGR